MAQNLKPRGVSTTSSTSSVTEFVNEAFVDSELELSKVVSIEVSEDNQYIKSPFPESKEQALQSALQVSKDGAEKEQEATGFRKMYIAAFTALLFAVCMGYTAAWSATATVDMMEPYSRIDPSDDDISWIGSLVAVGALLGGTAGGYLTNRLGRKGTLVMNVVPYVTGWILIAYASTTILIFIGRVVTGFSTGLVSVATPMYLVEIATPEVRGMLGASFQLFVVLGVLLISWVGSELTWQWSAVSGACLTLFATFLMLLVPESPRWLIGQKRQKEAKEAMRFLQGAMLDVDAECHTLEEEIRQQPSGGVHYQEFTVATVYKPFLLSIALMFFQQFSGINAVLFYTTQIFKSSGSSLEPATATILVAVVQVAATLVSSLLMDKAGRKPLLLLSGAWMAISLFCFGGFDFAKTNDASIVNTYGWAPLVCLMSFIAAFSIGYGPTPWLMVAEMTPIRFRSVVSGVATALNWTFAFIVTKSFKAMETGIKGYGVYWYYGSICFASLFLAIFFLPETKGKKESEIKEFFEK